MKKQMFAALSAFGLLAGCQTTTAYIKMVDPVCLAAPQGYVIKHDYPVVHSGKMSETLSRCPTILVPIETAEELAEIDAPGRIHRGEGQVAGRGNVRDERTITIEGATTRPGFAQTTQITLPGGSGYEPTVVTRAGDITIYSDGSVETPNLGRVE